MKVLVETSTARSVASSISVAFVDLMDDNPEIDVNKASFAALTAYRWFESLDPAYPLTDSYRRTFGDFTVTITPGTTKL